MKSRSHSSLLDAARPMVIGHRGSPSFAPENSLAGFEWASQLGLDGIEFDVHRAADGTLVVIHDAYLERTTMSSGRVADRTGSELQKIRLKGAHNQRIPLLSEVLGLFRHSALELLVELKTDAMGAAYRGMAAQVLDELERFGLESQSIITSFVPEVLHEAREHRPSCRVLGSLHRASIEMRGGFANAVAEWDAIPGCFIALEKKLFTYACNSSSDVELDLSKVSVWVVNDAEEMSRCFAQPVRQIITDRPELALLVRSKTPSHANARHIHT